MAFIPAVVLSLPTQLVNVWLGAYFEDEATGQASKTMKYGSTVITVVLSKHLFYFFLFLNSHHFSSFLLLTKLSSLLPHTNISNGK